MIKKSLVALCLMLGAGLLLCSTDSQAMPNFAREYNADCSMCHTIIPKLNKLGYEFRLAGFRLPSEIGKEEKPFNLGDFFVARIQEQYKWEDKKTPGALTDPTKTFTSSQLEFYELTIYPLTGSWGKNFASLGEFSMAPDETFEVENAYVRGVSGNENGWFQARIGVMHPWEGFGASDRPIGTTRPLIQKSKATGNPFFLWNLDQSGIEAGYYMAKSGTTISGNIWNGIIQDAAGNAEPAQGGGLTKTQGEPAANSKDFQVVVNQFISSESAVTLYYYRGFIPVPATGIQTKDTFDRLAAYADYWVVPKMIDVSAGYGYGKESLDDSSLAPTAGKSKGYFGEVDVHVIPNKFAVAGRYDTFDPSDKAGSDKQTAYTLSFNGYFTHGLQLVGDYQYKKTEQATAGDITDKTLIARMVFIW